MIASDYVIVGGGVYGVALAYELARAGREVCVLEAGEVACGASGGLGKRGVRANQRDIRELLLMRMAYEMWPDLAQTLQASTGYQRTGHLLLAEREQDLLMMPALEQSQNGFGIPTQILSANELGELEPRLCKSIQAALYCELDGIADHTATTRAYAGAARRLGAQIHEHSAVRELKIESGRIARMILANETEVTVKRAAIVLANQAGADLLRATCGLALPTWQVLPQAMVTEPLASPPPRHLVGHFSRTVSIKVLDDGAVMVSGGWRGTYDPDTGAPVAVEANVQGNWREAVYLYPELADQRIEQVTVERAESRCVDGIPIIDRVPMVSNSCSTCASACSRVMDFGSSISSEMIFIS